jgi:Immunity protein Imm1
MSPRLEYPILTATLTTGVARVTRGLSESISLIDEILTLEHIHAETTLLVGDVEFHQTREGPYPSSQMRVSARPSTGYAALNYADHNDPDLFIANSYNPRRPVRDVFLIFNGTLGTVFPPTAAIPIADTRDALNEWLHTRRRPTRIEWRPYDAY